MLFRIQVVEQILFVGIGDVDSAHRHRDDLRARDFDSFFRLLKILVLSRPDDTTRAARICNSSSSRAKLNPSAISLFSPLTRIFMKTKKPYPQYHLTVAREYGFKLVPIRSPERSRDCDFHASLRRCYPDKVRRVTWLFIRLSVRLWQTPLAFKDS